MRTPPKGWRLPRLSRSELSIACIMSARTIETSSITMVSIAFTTRWLRDLARIARIQQARREVEEGMDRLPADIHRREPRRREHDGLLERVEDQLAQQRRLARAGAAGEENVPPPAHDLVDERLVDVGCGLARSCRISRRRAIELRARP